MGVTAKSGEPFLGAGADLRDAVVCVDDDDGRAGGIGVAQVTGREPGEHARAHATCERLGEAAEELDLVGGEARIFAAAEDGEASPHGGPVAEEQSGLVGEAVPLGALDLTRGRLVHADRACSVTASERNDVESSDPDSMMPKSWSWSLFATSVPYFRALVSIMVAGSCVPTHAPTQQARLGLNGA